MKYEITHWNIEGTPYIPGSICSFNPVTLSDGSITIEVREGGQHVEKRLFVPEGSTQETIYMIAKNGAEDVAAEIQEDIKERQKKNSYKKFVKKSAVEQNKELKRLVEVLYDKVQAYDEFIKNVVGTIEKKETQIERDLSSADINYITTEKLKADVLVKSYKEFAYKGKWSDIEKEVKQIIGAD